MNKVKLTKHKNWITHYSFTVGKIAGKAVCRSVLLTIYALLQTVFFGDFAHWVIKRTLTHRNLWIDRRGFLTHTSIFFVVLKCFTKRQPYSTKIICLANGQRAQRAEGLPGYSLPKNIRILEKIRENFYVKTALSGRCLSEYSMYLKFL